MQAFVSLASNDWLRHCVMVQVDTNVSPLPSRCRANGSGQVSAEQVRWPAHSISGGCSRLQYICVLAVSRFCFPEVTGGSRCCSTFRVGDWECRYAPLQAREGCLTEMGLSTISVGVVAVGRGRWKHCIRWARWQWVVLLCA